MIRREVFLDWAFAIFVFGIVIFGLLHIFLPNPTIKPITGPLIQPTFLWDFSHFWYIAFMKPPFSVVFWTVLIADTILYCRRQKKL
jgi:hypothetical protein